MQMLSLDQQRAKLDHLNPRTELHGDERVPAVDLKISFETSNEILDSLHDGLRAAFYRKPTKNDSAELFDKTKDELPLRVLKFPKLRAQGWEPEYPGYTLDIAYGVSGANDLLFIATIDKIGFTCKEGGTVAMSFRAVVKPDGEMNELVSMLGSEITVTLRPPAETQQRIEDVKPSGASTTEAQVDGLVKSGIVERA